MIFTEALKKQVFGPAAKNSTLANAKIVERTTSQAQLDQPPNSLKAAKQIVILHEKPNAHS